MTPQLVERAMDRRLEQLLATVPAVMITGARAIGKTTTAQQLAKSVVRLDRPDDAAVYRGDPDAALRAETEPVLLDEWQEVPDVLGAVKRAVDVEYRPGRFLLTGSVHAHLDATSWPGTGRVSRVPMFGLTVGELNGDTTAGTTFLDGISAGRPRDIELPQHIPDIIEYLTAAARGGYPVPALAGSEQLSHQWLTSYADELVSRDLDVLQERRDPARFRRYLRAVMLHTADVVREATLLDAAGIDRKTAQAYDTILRDLFIIDHVPAWYSRQLPRLFKTAKRYALDPGLAAAILGLRTEQLRRDGQMLGRLLDTFVVAQLRPLLAVRDDGPVIHHLRQQDGRREVDLVIELADGRVIALEIKAAAAVDDADARHLVWLRDSLGDQFAGGAVLNTGKRAYQIADRVLAVPIAALWA